MLGGVMMDGTAGLKGVRRRPPGWRVRLPGVGALAAVVAREARGGPPALYRGSVRCFVAIQSVPPAPPSGIMSALTAHGKRRGLSAFPGPLGRLRHRPAPSSNNPPTKARSCTPSTTSTPSCCYHPDCFRAAPGRAGGDCGGGRCWAAR